MDTKVVEEQASWKNRLCGRCRRKLGSQFRVLSLVVDGPLCGRHKRGWKMLCLESREFKSDPRALCQGDCSERLVSSSVLEGTLVVRYRTQPWCWISLLDRCGFLRSMGMSKSTLSGALSFCGLQPALDRQFGDTLLHEFFLVCTTRVAPLFFPPRRWTVFLRLDSVVTCCRPSDFLVVCLPSQIRDCQLCIFLCKFCRIVRRGRVRFTDPSQGNLRAGKSSSILPSGVIGPNWGQDSPAELLPSATSSPIIAT